MLLMVLYLSCWGLAVNRLFIVEGHTLTKSVKFPFVLKCYDFNFVHKREKKRYMIKTWFYFRNSNIQCRTLRI